MIKHGLVGIAMFLVGVYVLACYQNERVMSPRDATLYLTHKVEKALT